MKCETCLNRYAVISENGLHYNCSLSEKQAVECILRKKEHYIKMPVVTEEEMQKCKETVKKYTPYCGAEMESEE